VDDGHALHVITLREDSELERQLAAADPEAYPRMAAVFPASRGERHDTSFDAALEVVLDGIDRRFLRPVRKAKKDKKAKKKG